MICISILEKFIERLEGQKDGPQRLRKFNYLVKVKINNLKQANKYKTMTAIRKIEEVNSIELI